ncbi:MAG: hypothetical protein IKE60_26310 [Reyranella sp.]|uniref:hypothetical protein n=1 Tax=Reyranella sp. TaxID=1929291 RepID=UPI0025E37844|nr:hypothetical protein [Reyranella sp.]MBR2818203.1 hypothetical protein [Reyranella sp.]
MQQPRLKLISRNRVKYLGTVYTRDQAIADLQAIQSTLDEGRMVSQKLYREVGSIPLPVIDALFGTYPEFKRQAGIIPTRHQNAIRNAVARSTATDRLRALRQERLSYGDRYVRDRGTRHKVLIACSDLHDRECDPFYRRVLIDSIKRVQPDAVSIVGDMFDCPEWSKHWNDPREWDAAGRIKAGLEILGEMREAAPDAQIDLIEGNHESRLVRQLAENSPGTMALLSDLHDWTMKDMFGLDRFEINYIAKDDMSSAYTDAHLRREFRKNHKTYWDSVLCHHFPTARHDGLPGVNGHHHSHNVWHMHNRHVGVYEWHQLGAGHRRDASYCDASKWSNGFAIIHVDTQSRATAFDYISITPTFSIVGGHRYERLPEEFYPALISENPKVKPFGK